MFFDKATFALIVHDIDSGGEDNSSSHSIWMCFVCIHVCVLSLPNMGAFLLVCVLMKQFHAVLHAFLQIMQTTCCVPTMPTFFHSITAFELYFLSVDLFVYYLKKHGLKLI